MMMVLLLLSVVPAFKLNLSYLSSLSFVASLCLSSPNDARLYDTGDFSTMSPEEDLQQNISTTAGR
jgi:hypothetical protein